MGKVAENKELSDKWFNIEDIAEYLSITEDTARSWRSTNGFGPER